ncbi:MAG: DUF998 domain-containing protein [Chloroflexota bacterium]|nr:DUF998 domain-containing protein [Chloroflexia bacterium]MDQ3227245.1 DUF998 domain-containing protein [Chloroflexota bacterium]
MADRPRIACRLAEVALTGVATNLIVLLISPLVRPELSVLEHSLSYYAIGPWWALQTLAFAALGMASFALGMALPFIRLSTTWIAPASLLLVISGFASVALVTFPMGSAGPATMLGDSHQTAGTVGAVAQLVAALCFAIAIRRDPAWGNWFALSVVLLTISVVGALGSQAAIWWPERGIPMGATMRLVVVPLLVLWGLVAARLRSNCERGLSRFVAAR